MAFRIAAQREPTLTLNKRGALHRAEPLRLGFASGLNLRGILDQAPPYGVLIEKLRGTEAVKWNECLVQGYCGLSLISRGKIL